MFVSVFIPNCSVNYSSIPAWRTLSGADETSACCCYHYHSQNGARDGILSGQNHRFCAAVSQPVRSLFARGHVAREMTWRAVLMSTAERAITAPVTLRGVTLRRLPRAARTLFGRHLVRFRPYLAASPVPRSPSARSAGSSLVVSRPSLVVSLAALVSDVFIRSRRAGALAAEFLPRRRCVSGRPTTKSS